ncbi:MAG: selenocysteine-specific translation elongation factor [Betaproteobacteria bacterium]|nr:selenocysteine-specific translation elongation factor [Betaproteobacteria bacterium]
MIVATAGHIDHGKTTLVHALTGVDTDRLPEEKARGISIDLGFAYWRPAGLEAAIGFVDVPGHERFVRNMLAGVCGIDFALLVVAADDGVMPQTLEHLHILDLLAITRGLAVVTKTDRVTAARVDEVVAGLRALLATTGLSGIEVLTVSAVTGTGMDVLREKLAAAAGAAVHRHREGRNFRFAIDRVFSVAGSGTVVTGTVFDGAVSAGDRLLLSPSGTEVRVRGLQMDGRAALRAQAGERCALNLSGIELADAARGDWLIAPALHAPTQRLDVKLTLLASEARALRHWTPVHLHHGARDVTARVSIPRGAGIAPGESAPAQLILDQPVAALRGDRYILRDQSALRTLGGGLILDPQAPARRRDAGLRAAQLAALGQDDPAAALAALLACSPAGVDLAWFARVYNLDQAALAALEAGAQMKVLGKSPPLGYAVAAIQGCEAGIAQSLARYLAENPQALGMQIADLRRACAPRMPAESFAQLLRLLAEAGQLEVSGSSARLRRHVATDNPADRKVWARVQPLLEAADFEGLVLAALAQAAGLREPALKDFLHRKARTGEVVSVTPERFYLRGTLARFAAIATAVARGLPDGKFSAAQVRDQTDIGRTRAIQLLECFDRLGITQRIGDLRAVRRDFESILGAAPPAPAPRSTPRTPAASAAPAVAARSGANPRNRASRR